MKSISRLQPLAVAYAASTSPRRGAIAVLVAVLMIIFLMAVAFSVDVGYMQLSRTRLRIATDAAARAHKEGGFIGIGGKEISPEEQAVLDQISAALS